MKNEIYQFIRSFFHFILFTCIIYVLLICFWGEFALNNLFKNNLNYQLGAYGHLYTRLEEVKKTKNIDILFLGSSHAYRGFDSRIFKNKGYKTFNLGSSSQTPLQAEIILKRYLDQLNPKIIIYEVYPKTFEVDGVEASLDLISNDENDLNSIYLALKLNNIKIYNTLIFGLYRDLFNLNSDFKEKIIRDGDRYISGGYVEKEIQHFKFLKYDIKKWNLNDKQLNSFEKIVEMTSKRNINLIIVQAPITYEYYKSHSNNNVFDEKMRAYGKYFNFNKMLQLNDSLHFYDNNHLNQWGVEIFNKALIDSVLSKPNTWK